VCASKGHSTEPHCSPITKRSHHIDGRSSRGTHTTHSRSLADVCLSVSALACAVACCGGLCWHGVSSGRDLMTNLWEALERQRDSSTGLTSQPSIHVYGSVGSVIHRDVVATGSVRSVAVCAVCTAPCLVELDLISRPRGDPIYHRQTYIEAYIGTDRWSDTAICQWVLTWPG
jgi:hypothetical protein